MNSTILPATILALLLLLPASAQSQGAASAGTNQPVSPSKQTNAPPAQGRATNLPAALPPLPTNQINLAPLPPPALFQTSPATTGAPTTPGSGNIGSPLLGNSSLGAPGLGGGEEPATPGIYHNGPVILHARLTYLYSEASEVESTPGQRTTTILNSVSPGLTLDMGSHWVLTYTPDWMFYLGGRFKDSTAQFASLAYIASNADWVLTLAQTYFASSQPLVETATQTQEDAYVTALSATHALSGKWSATLGANQTFRFASPFSDVRAWSGSAAINYIINPKVQTGLSLSGGYDAINQGTDITFESLQGTLSLRPGAKTVLTLSGGAERQEFNTAGMPPLTTPIFSAALDYALFHSTTISVNAQRSVSPSFYVNQDDVITMVNSALRQELGRKLSLTLMGGYSTASYTTLAPGPLPAFYLGYPMVTLNEEVRSDSTTFFNVALAYRFRPSLAASIFFMQSQNSSSQGAFAFSSTQGGVQLSYHY